MTRALRNSLAVVAAAAMLAIATVLATASPAAAACCQIFVDDQARSEYFSREDRGLMGFRIWLGWTPSSTVTIGYQTSNGSAIAGADYIAASGTVSIPAGQNQAWITVGIKHDTINENNESFSFKLTSTSLGRITDGTAVGIIMDDDPSRLNALNADTVDEHSGWMWFSVRLSAPMTSTVTVQYATDDGSATAWADYMPTSGSLTFSPGETHKWVAVQIIDDSTIESSGREWVWLNLTNATGTTIADAWGYGYILENDFIR